MAGTGSRLSLALAAVGSLLAHAALAGLLLLGLFAEAGTGGGGRVLEAVSIELVDGSALDALRQPATVPSQAGADASVADSEGTPADAPPQTAAEAEAKPEPARPEPPAEKIARAPPADPPQQEIAREPPPIAVAALALPDAAPPFPSEPQEVKAPPPEPEARPAPAPPPSAVASGGAAARASAAQADARAAAGASPGEVNRYNGQVSREISAVMRRLATSGRRGALVLVFTIGDDGDVIQVRLKEPSGDRALDDLVLRLVRNASFPEPPARMSELQRTFSVPIRVK